MFFVFCCHMYNSRGNLVTVQPCTAYSGHFTAILYVEGPKMKKKKVLIIIYNRFYLYLLFSLKKNPENYTKYWPLDQKTLLKKFLITLIV